MATLLEAVFRNISLSRNRQLDSWNIYSDIEQFLTYHQRIVIENWLFYLGYQNLFLERFEAEDDLEFANRVKTATIENHIKPIINLIVAHLYGKEDSVKRYTTRNGEPDKTINDILQKVVWNNDKSRDLDDSKALNALISGFSVIKRVLADTRTGLPFPGVPNRLDVSKFGFIKKELIDSSLCLPLPWIDENNIVHPERLGGILYVAEQSNFIGSMELMRLLRLTQRSIMVMEYITDDIWVRYVKDKNAQEWTQQNIGSGSNTNRNPYGRIDIPFTVYRNTGDIFTLEGDSDVLDMKSLNLELNEHGNADKDMLRYHGYPILVGRGIDSLPKEFKRTKNAFLGMPASDKKNLEYLTWDGKRQDSQVRADTIRKQLSMTTGVSLLSRGFMSEIGQIRSGPPLKALFTTDRAVMARKFTKFSTYEKADMRADLQFWEKATGVDLNIDNTVQFNACFNDDFLGIDKLLEAEIEALEIGSGAESIEEVISDNHPDWTGAQISAEIKKIQAAKQLQKTSIPQQSVDKSAISQASQG